MIKPLANVDMSQPSLKSAQLGMMMYFVVSYCIVVIV